MPFDVSFTFKGKSHTFQVTCTTTAVTTITGRRLYEEARKAFELDETTTEVKLLLKGKRIDDTDTSFPFSEVVGDDSNKKVKTPKIMVMATPIITIDELSTKRSDPTIRGFDQELNHSLKRQQQQQQTQHWSDGVSQQHKEYKFCRFDPCHDQSFGHRATDNKTPHAFAARQLLEKMATDPGIVAVMKERELVVGTLGEMDPIDDRIMLAKQRETNDQSCLLGYNTNAGSRIDIKLRTDDLSGFRPYSELISTLIHELSHNWVGEHNLLFWTNYAQMRSEYIFTHARLMRSSLLVNGKTTAELAGLDRTKLTNVYQCIMSELVREMAQHHLHPNMIESPIRQRIKELEEEDARNHYQGRRLGGSGMNSEGGGDSTVVEVTPHC
jgi:WLM domain